MLNNQISWYGKLPNHADFIQSHNDIEIESIFMNWLTEGQDHIGEHFFHNKALQIHYFYVFTINTLYKKTQTTVYGLLFTSTDESGRLCPFISFTRSSDYFYNGFLLDFENQLLSLKFEVTQLSDTLNHKDIMASFENLLNQEKNHHDKFGNTLNTDNWVQTYPKHDLLTLNVNKMSPIVYRKLMSR